MTKAAAVFVVTPTPLAYCTFVLKMPIVGLLTCIGATADCLLCLDFRGNDAGDKRSEARR